MYDAKCRLSNLLKKGVEIGKEEYYQNLYKKTILEIGFGNGALLNVLDNQENIVYGIDASKLAILNMIEKNPKIPTILIDASRETLPFQDGHFDYAFMYNSLEYMQSPLFALMEVKRVLKNDGIFMLCYDCEQKIMTYPDLFKYENMRKFLNQLYFKVVDESRIGNNIYQKCENKKVDRMELLDLVNNNIYMPDLYDDIETELTLAL